MNPPKMSYYSPGSRFVDELETSKIEQEEQQELLPSRHFSVGGRSSSCCKGTTMMNPKYKI